MILPLKALHDKREQLKADLAQISDRAALVAHFRMSDAFGYFGGCAAARSANSFVQLYTVRV